jgi:hypothetical protein
MVFGVGCIGAAAPEIVRLYKSRLEPATFPRSYYSISIVFFVLGGFVALILPATTVWGAFYVGVSLPSIISGVASGSFKKTKAIKRPLKEIKGVSEEPLIFQGGLAKSSVREYLALLWR